MPAQDVGGACGEEVRYLRVYEHLGGGVQLTLDYTVLPKESLRVSSPRREQERELLVHLGVLFTP